MIRYITGAIMKLQLNKISDEVFIATEEIVCFDASVVDFIRECAILAPRGRARICAHKKPSDTLHEMLIGIRHDSYIRPHRHLNKVESFHLVEGAADVVILTDDGQILNVVELSTERNFFYRLDTPKYHTLLIHTPVLIIHESTNGPFDLSATDFSSFSPEEGVSTVSDFIDRLKMRVRTWKREYAGK